MLRRELSQAGKRVKHQQNKTTEKLKPKRCRHLFAALSDYLDGVVDEDFCERMQKHLSDCQPCEAFLADLESVVQRCRSLDQKCPPEKAAEMRQELLESYDRAKRNLLKRDLSARTRAAVTA
jgi:hypothetical protein